MGQNATGQQPSANQDMGTAMRDLLEVPYYRWDERTHNLAEQLMRASNRWDTGDPNRSWLDMAANPRSLEELTMGRGNVSAALNGINVDFTNPANATQPAGSRFDTARQVENAYQVRTGGAGPYPREGYESFAPNDYSGTDHNSLRSRMQHLIDSANQTYQEQMQRNYAERYGGGAPPQQAPGGNTQIPYGGGGVSTQPVGGGSTYTPPGGGSTYTPPGGGSNTTQPPGYGGSGGGWNWGPQVAPPQGGGGSNPSDFSQPYYVPGAQSPWGQPDVPGNNADFYRNQLNELLKQGQNYQVGQYAAALRREQAANNPQPPQTSDWRWASLPQVQVAQQGDPGTGGYTYTLDPSITPGQTTNQQIANLMISRGHLTPDQQSAVAQHWQEAPEIASGTRWSQAASPQELTSAVGGDIHPTWLQTLNAIWNPMFNRADLNPPTGGGPSASPGYALPVPVSRE